MPENQEDDKDLKEIKTLLNIIVSKLTEIESNTRGVERELEELNSRLD